MQKSQKGLILTTSLKFIIYNSSTTGSITNFLQVVWARWRILKNDSLCNNCWLLLLILAPLKGLNHTSIVGNAKVNPHAGPCQLWKGHKKHGHRAARSWAHVFYCLSIENLELDLSWSSTHTAVSGIPSDSILSRKMIDIDLNKVIQPRVVFNYRLFLHAAQTYTADHNILTRK